MDIQIEHLGQDPVEPELETHARERLRKIGRHYPDEQTFARLTFADENSSHKNGIDKRVSLELSLPHVHERLFAEATKATHREALDEVLDRIERQVEKHKPGWQ